jgi:glycosyltransferase involved in cell wall biosynthesis
VIDDGSPDRSAEVCRKIGDPRVRVFSRKNSGSCRARNFGISQARGEYIAFIDHDDLWMPEKLAKHVAHLDAAPSVGVSYGPSEFMDFAGRRLGLRQVPRLTNIDAREIICHNPIGNGSVPVIRREVFEAIRYTAERDGQLEQMYFDDECMGWEDVECWFRIAYTTGWKFEGIADCLTLYRLAPGGISGDPSKKQARFEHSLNRVRRYASSFLQQHEAAARAYHLRYLARRQVQAHDKAAAVRFAHRALACYPRMVLEQPARTLTTLAAAYALRVLPAKVYDRIEQLAMRQVGSFHATRSAAQ